MLIDVARFEDTDVRKLSDTNSIRQQIFQPGRQAAGATADWQSALRVKILVEWEWSQSPNLRVIRLPTFGS